jgi:chromosome segregation ATPase
MTVGDLFEQHESVRYQLVELRDAQAQETAARGRLEREVADMRATTEALQREIDNLQAELARRRRGGGGGGRGGGGSGKA